MNNVENEGEIQFSVLLEQIGACLEKRLYYVAIMTSLVIPDIGGAIDSDNGEATQKKYVTWFDKYVKPRYSGKANLTGDECYYLRCSMLHQGKIKHSKIKVAFMRFPQSRVSVYPFLLPNNLGRLIEPHTFCNHVIYAAYDWLEVVHDSDRFKKNIRGFMNMYSLTFVDKQDNPLKTHP